MNFVGTGRRLAQGDVGDAARAIGIETAVLLAFLEVEAAGRGFDGKNRPKMLFEPHVMYRNTSGATRRQAVNAGVAYKSWGTRPYPADSYPRLNTAISIAREPGFRSASYGLPQILGENHAAAGFASAEAMFVTMKQGEREQLLAMVTLLKAWGLAKHLVGKDFTDAENWRPVAARYNGSGYAKNAYHTKLAAAYVKHTKGEAMDIPPPATVILSERMKGEAVHNLQADLAALGFDPGPIDGRFGPKTTAALRAFQGSHKLTVDGRAGPQTFAAIDGALAALENDQTPPPPEWPGQQPPTLSGGAIIAIILGVAIAAALFFFTR